MYHPLDTGSQCVTTNGTVISLVPLESTWQMTWQSAARLCSRTSLCHGKRGNMRWTSTQILKRVTYSLQLRYHTDGTYKMIAQVRRIQIYRAYLDNESFLITHFYVVDPPESLEFASVREWLLRIVTLALDSDPDLMPRSALPQPDLSTPELSPSTSPTLSPESPESSSLSNSLSSILESPDSAITNPEPPSSISHDDDFRFWTDEHGRPTMRQAKRISYAVEEAIGVWLAPESIMEYPNVTSLTRRILRMLWRQQNALAERSSSGDRTALSEAPTKRHLRANMVAGVSSKFSSFK